MLSALPTTWIIVPCYNEEHRLDVSAFARFMRSHPSVRFCFVNDGSCDRTADILAQLTVSSGGRAITHHLEKNSGKAEAVRRGVLHALSHARTAYVGYWDADLATPLDEIPRFLETAIERNSAVMLCGSRIRRLGATILRRQRRHILGRVFATLASIALRMPVYDTQCGAKIFASSLARRIFAEPFMSAWCFDVELLARAGASLSGADEIIEVPLLRWEDVSGSKLRAMHFAKAGLDLLRILVQFRLYPQTVTTLEADAALEQAEFEGESSAVELESSSRRAA